ncbi:hypothetical protein JYA63_03500 [Fictibacillus nanhaiensis]|uniref:Uncharacterized protein n=1 Tax=Fictibacillus nanhaiensis TaxID=742169 RepID=A0ABS2ZPP7_9BACL|nr:hypothetical protein [Fictibacillus nanhaiensis]
MLKIKRVYENLTKIIVYLFNIKNLRSNWGQLLLLLIPIILTIPPLLATISDSVFGIVGVVVLFIMGWSHNLNNIMNCEEYKNDAEKLDRDVEHLISTLESVPEKVVKAFYNKLDFTYNE